MGTRITCSDQDSGESASREITDDYMVITDGKAYVASVVSYATGTEIITVKRAASLEEARHQRIHIRRYLSRSAEQ